MNWFNLLKFAQIWKTNPIGESDFANLLSDIYELEYKYSILKTRKFNGTEQRKFNILNKLEQELQIRINKILPFLRVVFRDWLTTHALLDPKKWAKQKIKSYKDYEEDYYLISEAISEAKLYGIDVVKKINDNINSFPEIKKYLELVFEEYEESLQDYVEEEYLTEEEVQEIINNLSLLVYLENFYGNWDEGLEELLNQGIKDGYINEDEVLLEIASLTFEGWYAKWKAEGIDTTRKNIVKVYNMLNNIKNKTFNEIIAIINMAINTAHQTGPMLDYIQDKVDDIDLDRVLLSLTNGDNVEEWNQELKNIGVNL